MRTIPLFLLLQGLSFAVVGLVHGGLLVNGFQDQPASVAESSIAIVLLLGFAVVMAAPAWTRTIALIVQSLALFGTLVGVFTIAIGIGPQTALDLVIHAAFLAMLTWGLVVTARAPADRARQRVSPETLRGGPLES